MLSGLTPKDALAATFERLAAELAPGGEKAATAFLRTAAKEKGRATTAPLPRSFVRSSAYLLNLFLSAASPMSPEPTSMRATGSGTATDVLVTVAVVTPPEVPVLPPVP